METGYFFCGDIIGFSNLVENLDPLSLHKKIEEWVLLVNEAAIECGLSKVRLLSDTVYSAVNNDKNELKKLIKFSRVLLNNGIVKLLPIRGAISFGQYYWDDLIYGRAVLSAHQLEKSQKWIGVIIHPDILISEEECYNFGVIFYPVTMLDNLSKLYCSVIWKPPFFHEMTNFLCLKASSKKIITLDKDCIEKIRNTANYGNYLRKAILHFV